MLGGKHFCVSQVLIGKLEKKKEKGRISKKNVPYGLKEAEKKGRKKKEHQKQKHKTRELWMGGVL